jgi:hypothetical protein
MRKTILALLLRPANKTTYLWDSTLSTHKPLISVSRHFFTTLPVS